MSQPGPELQIQEREIDDITVVTLSGEITVDKGDIAFAKCIDALVNKGKVLLVINLAEVTYIDSAGVGMMVAKLKTVQKKGGAMKLAQLSARSHHLLALMKLRLVFDILDDEAAAVRSFSWGLRQ
jgi:anti-sigma B factor antagonist